MGTFSLACSNAKNRYMNPAAGDTTVHSLAGRWTVTSGSKSGLSITPACKSIGAGTVFKFTKETLEVYPADTPTPCDVFGVRSSPNSVSLIKDDMVWLCNYSITGNTLTLTSNSFFTINQNETKPSPANETPTSAEVVVTLIKH